MADAERGNADHGSAGHGYCGRCAFDYGLARPLIWFGATDRKGTKILYCTFCGEERELGGSHIRLHIVKGGKHAGDENVIHIQHVVSA